VNYYAGIDVSLELSSMCIVDATGEIVKEAKVESHADALVKFFKAFGLPLTVIGLEAGPLSQWLYAGLTEAGFVNHPHGDPPCQSGVVRYNGEDRSARRTRHRSAFTHGMVPAGSRPDRRDRRRCVLCWWHASCCNTN